MFTSCVQTFLHLQPLPTHAQSLFRHSSTALSIMCWSSLSHSSAIRQFSERWSVIASHPIVKSVVCFGPHKRCQSTSSENSDTSIWFFGLIILWRTIVCDLRMFSVDCFFIIRDVYIPTFTHAELQTFASNYSHFAMALGISSHFWQGLFFMCYVSDLTLTFDVLSTPH